MAKKTKIPKRIAGVKLPKELRRAGDALIERAQSPQGREVMLGALAMAATAATAAMAKRAQPPEPPRPPESADAPAHGTTREPDFHVIAETIGKSAEQMLGRLFRGTQG